jgi:blocked-early-in-transport protein 1
MNSERMRRQNGQGSSAGYTQLRDYESHQMMEQENDRLANELTSKVSALKHLTIDIGNEVRNQNRLLGDMDDEFDSSGGLLQSTMGRLTKMSKAGHHKLMWYLILFALFVFFVCYLSIKWF